jgi:hypothetical protein
MGKGDLSELARRDPELAKKLIREAKPWKPNETTSAAGVASSVAGRDGQKAGEEKKPSPAPDEKKDPGFFTELAEGFETGGKADDPRACDHDDDQAEFPIWCFPTVMRDMAEAISESARIPLSLSGPLILGVISGAIGKGLELESGADRIIRGNLYMLGLGKSGTGKSSAFKLGAEPITAAEIGMLKFWREIRGPEIKAELRILDREIKSLEAVLGGKKKVDVDRSKLKKELAEKIAKVAYWQEELQEPRMIVEDVTQEALGVLLARNSEQLFSLSADAGKTLQNLEGRYMKEKGKSDDDIYIKAYTGDRCVVDRIGRDPVILENPCLSLFWLIQPERAQRLFSNPDLRNGGFLPRCLIWDSRVEPTEQPEEDRPIPAKVQENFNNLLKGLLDTYHNGKEHTIPPSRLAKESMRTYHNSLVARRRKDWCDINSFVARWTENAWRILVNLHAGAHFSNAHLTQIDRFRPDHAIELSKWFGTEQIRLLSAMRESADWDTLSGLIELVNRVYKGKATIRDLGLRHGYRREELERLAEKYPSKIAIRREEPGEKGGRPSWVLVVLPTK